MRVMMLVKMSVKTLESGKPPTNEQLTAMHEFNEELQRAGVLLDLGGLTPPNAGKVIRFANGKRTVLDGPFTEAKEVIAGYTLLEVKSLDEAVEWAKRAPFGTGDDHEVEIRPLFDASNYDPA